MRAGKAIPKDYAQKELETKGCRLPDINFLTSFVMMSFTGVSLDDLPSKIIFRR